MGGIRLCCVLDGDLRQVSPLSEHRLMRNTCVLSWKFLQGNFCGTECIHVTLQCEAGSVLCQVGCAEISQGLDFTPPCESQISRALSPAGLPHPAKCLGGYRGMELCFCFCSPKDPATWCRCWAFEVGPGKDRRGYEGNWLTCSQQGLLGRPVGKAVDLLLILGALEAEQSPTDRAVIILTASVSHDVRSESRPISQATV